VTRLIGAFALVWLVAGAVAVARAPAPLPRPSAAGALPILAGCFLVPTVCAWLGAEAARLRRTPRLLDPRLRRRLAPAALGLALGAASLAVASVALVYAPDQAPDAAVTGASSLLVCFLAVLPLPRVRAGVCIACGYDLAGATPDQRGRCPECGADVMRIA
jgi:hypothetical protein